MEKGISYHQGREIKGSTEIVDKRNGANLGLVRELLSIGPNKQCSLFKKA